MALNPFLFDLDDQPVLEFTVLRRDGTVYDLTGASVDLLVEGVGEFPCSVTTPTEGLCERTVDVGDFPVAGRYRSQLRISGGGSTFHTDIFVVQVSESIDSTATGALPVSLFPDSGGVLFGVGGGLAGQDVSNFFWDDTNNILRLFGGTSGTGAAKVIVLGPGTTPSTSPANSIQLWGGLVGGANTLGLILRDEKGGVFRLGSTNTTDSHIAITNSVGTVILIRTGSGEGVFQFADPFRFRRASDSDLTLSIEPAAGNMGLGTTSFGTSAARVFSHVIGTAPTTSPADVSQEYVVDIAGGGTAGKHWRDETGHVHRMGRVIDTAIGDSTGKASVGGTIGANFTTQGTPGNTTETVLHTITFPASAFAADGQAASFWFIGKVAANGNTKTVRLKVDGTGGVTIVDTGGITTNDADWCIKGSIMRTASGAAIAEATLWVGPAGAATGTPSVHRVNHVALTPTFSNAITLDLTGQNGSASANDITAIASNATWEPV